MLAVVLLAKAVILPVALTVWKVKLSVEEEEGGEEEPVVAVSVVVTGFIIVCVAVSVLCASKVGARVAQSKKAWRMALGILLFTPLVGSFWGTGCAVVKVKTHVWRCARKMDGVWHENRKRRKERMCYRAMSRTNRKVTLVEVLQLSTRNTP